jgi:tetratricopeptide (TPR) repeat protein
MARAEREPGLANGPRSVAWTGRLLLAALSVASGACGSGDPDPVLPATARADAPPLALDGLDPDAAELVRRAAAELDEDVESPERWTQLGLALHAHDRLDAARACYEQRLLRDAEDARTWYWLALAEDELGRIDLALEHLEQCLRRAPDYPPVHWRRGFLLLGRGEIEHAAKAFQAALDIAPHDAATVVGMARVEIQQGAHAAAAARLEAHLRRLPRDANARYLLGTTYRTLGRTQEAERLLAGSSGAEPLRVDPWRDEMRTQRLGYRTDFLRAVERLGRGEVAAAIALLEELRARQPEDTLVLVNLHRARRLNGELDRALELLLDARELDPLLDVVHLHLAGVYRDLARRDGGAPDRALLEAAFASSQVACELSPTRADAHGMHGDVLAELGRADEALAAHVRAAELDRDAAMWQERAASALCNAGRWAEAVPHLRRLDLLQPRSARTLFHLGAALANSGALEEARVTLEQARFLAPEDAAIRKALERLGG